MPLQADIPVTGMMSKLQSAYPERRDELIRLLGIDPEWRMNRVSDGQRRRVQLFLGLVRPFEILLLDEVTVSLDVVVRQDLLRWLRRETEVRIRMYGCGESRCIDMYGRSLTYSSIQHNRHATPRSSTPLTSSTAWTTGPPTCTSSPTRVRACLHPNSQSMHNGPC